MQLTQTIQCQCRVTATLQEDGTLTASLFASAPYNDRGGTATAQLAVSDDLRAELAAVMQRILAAGSPALGEALGEAIHTARRAAQALGER
jgi:hypothetical protein